MCQYTTGVFPFRIMAFRSKPKSAKSPPMDISAILNDVSLCSYQLARALVDFMLMKTKISITYDKRGKS